MRDALAGSTQALSDVNPLGLALLIELVRAWKLTQQYDDTNKDGYDGSGAQPSSNDPLHVHTVSMVIALTDLDPQI